MSFDLSNNNRGFTSRSARAVSAPLALSLSSQSALAAYGDSGLGGWSPMPESPDPNAVAGRMGRTTGDMSLGPGDEIGPNSKVKDVLPNKEALLTSDFFLRRFDIDDGDLIPSEATLGASREIENSRRQQNAAADLQNNPGLKKNPDSKSADTAGRKEASADRRLRNRKKDEINWDYAVIERMNPANFTALPDFVLEDDDDITVPTRPGYVSAVGAIYNDNVLIYHSEHRVKDCLKVAGVMDSAEEDNTFVLRADGSILSSRHRNVSRADVYPGDTIVVPEKYYEESGYSVFMRGLKDWTQIIFQLGLGAAAIHSLNK